SYQTLPIGNAALDNIPWAPLNLGLPDVLVTDISYTPTMTLKTPSGSQTRGDVLLVSTLGAGVFQISNASTKLGKTNVLFVTGPARPGDAEITIKPSPHDPAMIRVVVVDNTLSFSDFQANSIVAISVSNLGAGATLTIDTGLNFPGGIINFNGGG